MPRPRLLYLCTRFPWPFDRGDRMRAWNLIEQFSRHANVTLVSFTEGRDVDAPVDRLLPLCERVEVVSLPRSRSQLNMVRGIAARAPFQVAYYRSEVMEKLADRLAREHFDLAFAQLFRMRPYLDRLRRTRKVMELSDSLTLNLRRALPLKPWHLRPAFAEELRRVERYENETMRRVEESWVVAGEDRRDLLARVPDARVEVVPNGIVRRWGAAGLEGPKGPVALFLGNLTVAHNVDAARHLAREIWPLVRRAVPDARLRLVGAPGRAVASLAALPGVSLEGFVEDLSPLLREARLSVAPLRCASGIQNKVLETMAAGLPAVVTPMVAAPIGAEPGHQIAVAEGAGPLADEIVRLLRDEALARRIGEAGCAHVTARFSWDRAGERMRELLA